MHEAFLELSSAITGFSRVELQGTGMVEEYLNTLTKQTSQSTVQGLITAWEGARTSSAPLEDALREAIFADRTLGPVARSLIKMWYLGQWEDPSDSSKVFVVSGEAYQQGLVWDAIGAHPLGAKQQGFGTWSLPPDSLERGAS